MDQAIACHDGFVALYEAEVDGLYAFFVRRVSPSVAEELTAETFAAAFASLDHHDPALGSHPAWLMGIALNVLRHHYRSERRRLHHARERVRGPGHTGDHRRRRRWPAR